MLIHFKIPGGNTTSHDACAKQYGVDQTVFGKTRAGIESVEDCDNLPEGLQDACRWRFDWFQDAQYPRYMLSFAKFHIVTLHGLTSRSATFKRVVCPTELTDKTKCIRNDEQAFAEGRSSASTLAQSPLLLGLAVIIAGLLSV